MEAADAVALALDAAERGLSEGEMPIGAVVLGPCRMCLGAAVGLSRRVLFSTGDSRPLVSVSPRR